MRNIIIAIGALNAFIAIASGAFAAHALKTSISEYSLQIFHTAASYQMHHALGMVLTGLLITKNQWQLRFSAMLMLIGIILFSGSLYILSLTGIRWLGMITPLGGICFLSAWLLLAYHFLFQDQNTDD
jgi:uncharacterized membrane protein YgdD (TMEM256/DUF423 family)